MIGTLGHFSVASSTHCGKRQSWLAKCFHLARKFAPGREAMLVIGTEGMTRKSLGRGNCSVVQY